MLRLRNTTDHSALTIKPFTEADRGDRQWPNLDELKTGMSKAINVVVKEGPSIEVFVGLVETSFMVSTNIVSTYKEPKSKTFTETDQAFVKDYLEYTDSILSFCSDLTQFLEAARHKHSEIKNMTSIMKSDMKSESFKKILEDLNYLKDSEAKDVSCKNLLTKMSLFESQQKELITNLNERMESRRRKKKTDGHTWWYKTIKMGCLFGMFIVSIADYFIAPGPKKEDKIKEYGKKLREEGVAWVAFTIEAFKPNKRDIGSSTQTETLRKVDVHVIKELHDIHRLIKGLENAIDSVLKNVKCLTNRDNVDLAMEDMPSMLDRFLKKIEESEGKLQKCVSEIEKARDMLVKCNCQFENKGSCSIL